ncbi:MAG: acyltransferase family protein [Alphaproteobacteria bacterium]|nr:acyltransferase family protein [Alphaproteobacteria bacterium]
MAEARHIGWVDSAKGMSILMVVLLYAVYSVGEDMGQAGLLHYAVGFMSPFRMPDFFAVSGLFLSRTLAKGDTHFFDRRVFHYVYFYLLWLVIHIVLKVALAEGDPAGALSQALWALVEPYGVLWFLYVLALVNLAVWAFDRLKVPHWLGLAGAAALQIAPVETGAYAIDQFSAYFVYFYAGYALAPLIFRLVELGQRHRGLAVAGLLAWAYMNAIAVFLPTHTLLPAGVEMGLAALPGLGLVYGLLGLMALFTLAGLVAEHPAFAWLRWIGGHSLMLYVAFALPMTATRLVLLKSGLIADQTAITVIVLAVSVAMPFLLYAMVKRTGIGGFLFERPAVLHLDGLSAPHAGLRPAE